MERYIWSRRGDGVNIIHIGKLWEKLMLAARVIVTIRNPADVCAVAARTFGQRAVLKFAHYTGAQSLAGRFTPGTFTNQIQQQFMEPRLLIISDPRLDHQAVREAAYVNIPVIAFCNADTSMRYIDIAIPCNNTAKFSVGLLYWFLTREVLRLRGEISRAEPWNVKADLFFFREPEEVEKAQAEEEDRKKSEMGADVDDDALVGVSIEGFAQPTDWATAGNDWVAQSSEYNLGQASGF